MYINVDLKCPDGLSESLGFDLPREIDGFIKFINNFSVEKNYTIKLKKTSTLEILAELKGANK